MLIGSRDLRALFPSPRFIYFYSDYSFFFLRRRFAPPYPTNFLFFSPLKLDAFISLRMAWREFTNYVDSFILASTCSAVDVYIIHMSWNWVHKIGTFATSGYGRSDFMMPHAQQKTTAEKRESCESHCFLTTVRSSREKKKWERYRKNKSNSFNPIGIEKNDCPF